MDLVHRGADIDRLLQLESWLVPLRLTWLPCPYLSHHRLEARFLIPGMDIHKLIQRVAAAEDQARSTQFLAPCVRGGQVRTRISGLVLTYHPDPDTFEGWGIFQPQDQTTAVLVEEAGLAEIEAYLQLLQPLPLILVSQLRGATWLGYPAHEESSRRLFSIRPLPVHLVENGDRFESIWAAWDGGTCWFGGSDGQADPTLSETLRKALRDLVQPRDLKLKGLTPEHRVTYDLATQGIAGFQAQVRERQTQARLQQALDLGGGTLEHYQDQGDYWLVSWQTADGHRHTSAIQKSDLTVVAAGICLSGRDRDFDLQSLVGVVEGS